MPHSARLAVWTTAWLSGDVAFDDVLDAMERGGAAHIVVGLPVAIAARRRHIGPVGTGEPTPSVVEAQTDATDRLGAALIAWRGSARSVQVVFPAPGDVRGLPGPGPFTSAALDAGEAVLGGGLGLVPTLPSAAGSRGGPPSASGAGAASGAEAGTGGETGTRTGTSSARPTVVWRAYSVAAAAPDPLQLSEAAHELAVAMRETATLFTAADLSGARTDVGDQLDRARRAGELLDLPAGFPQRATALLAQAERLWLALDLAMRDVEGGAVDRHGLSTRAQALRTLASTVRRTRQAAYNADRAGP